MVTRADWSDALVAHKRVDKHNTVQRVQADKRRGTFAKAEDFSVHQPKYFRLGNIFAFHFSYSLFSFSCSCSSSISLGSRLQLSILSICRTTTTPALPSATYFSEAISSSSSFSLYYYISAEKSCRRKRRCLSRSCIQKH